MRLTEPEITVVLEAATELRRQVGVLVRLTEFRGEQIVMTQPNRSDQEFVQRVEELEEARESSLKQNGLLSHERKETYCYVVRQFIKWIKDDLGSHLPRSH